MHGGPSIAATLNDRLDYFGQTVNIAARVQGLAGAGEICVSGETHAFPGVDELLVDCSVLSESASVRGIRDKLAVCRITVGA